ncbi:hypothetical protein ElyMa_001711100 [Elysia marginata]|uniref:Uncharacterized protein n=1 Tax=Elysia marginata TaxID=1093978 RepID=A0AAV4JY05_9GAST|nr:hypothetical protein ElyMa_001711100 [Elysia marginata]
MTGHGRSEISTGPHTHKIMVIGLRHYVSPVREFRPHHRSGYGRFYAFNGERGEVWGDFREGKDRHRRAYHKENGDTCKLVTAVSRSPERVEPAMVGMMKNLETAMGGIIQRIE